MITDFDLKIIADCAGIVTARSGAPRTPVSLLAIASVLGGFCMVWRFTKNLLRFWLSAMAVATMALGTTFSRKISNNCHMNWTLKSELPIIHHIVPNTT